MTARTSYNILQKITQDLKRRTVPTLPPAPGCEGDDEYQQQVTIWQNWIEWEKEGLCGECCVEKRREWEEEIETVWEKVDGWI